MVDRASVRSGLFLQSGNVAEDGVAVTRNGARDWRKADGCDDLVIPDEVVLSDLEKLPLALHVECLEGYDIRGKQKAWSMSQRHTAEQT